MMTKTIRTRLYANLAILAVVLLTAVTAAVAAKVKAVDKSSSKVHDEVKTEP